MKDASKIVGYIVTGIVSVTTIIVTENAFYILAIMGISFGLLIILQNKNPLLEDFFNYIIFLYFYYCFFYFVL